MENAARQCELADDITAAANAANAANAAGAAAYAANAAAAAAYAANAAGCAAYAAENAAGCAAYAAAYAARAAENAANAAAYADQIRNTEVNTIFAIAVSILDEAIQLGNQSNPMDRELVVNRMEKIKQRSLENV